MYSVKDTTTTTDRAKGGLNLIPTKTHRTTEHGHARLLVSLYNFAEGDETHVKLDTDEEFIKEINDWFDWGIKGGWEPRIDPGLNKET